MGGDIPTAAPGGIAGTGIEAPSFVQVSIVKSHTQSHTKQAVQHKEPDTWSPYKKKGEASSSVIALIQMLIKDLVKEMAEAETQENNSQKEYEQMMADSNAKRRTDMKSVAEKESTKADFEQSLTTTQQDVKDQKAMHLANEEYRSGLHAKCDWLISNYGLRKEARAQERDALNNAKGVLAGASG